VEFIVLQGIFEQECVRLAKKYNAAERKIIVDKRQQKIDWLFAKVYVQSIIFTTFPLKICVFYLTAFTL